MTDAAMLILLSCLDRALTGIISAIKAIQTDNAEVQAKKDALIAKMKNLEDFTDPMESKYPAETDDSRMP